MMNNYFSQVPNNNIFGAGFPQNNGVTFNNIAPAKVSSSTPEEMSIIKSKIGSKFNFDENDSAVAGWDYREGDKLCIEVVDPETDRVRAKYTGEEFNIVLKDVEYLKTALNIIKNFVCTTKLLNVNLDPNISKQMYISFGILEKLLPTAYINGIKNYNNIKQQVSNMVGTVGYQGNFGQQPYMYNGMYGASPNYFVNENGMPNTVPMMNNNFVANPNVDINSIIQQAAAQGAQAAYSQMGVPTNPVGGTFMNSPFVQGGQQIMPNQQPSVPFPGQVNNNMAQYQPANSNPNPTPTMNNAPYNPPIGANNVQTTTTSTTV